MKEEEIGEKTEGEEGGIGGEIIMWLKNEKMQKEKKMKTRKVIEKWFCPFRYVTEALIVYY